MAAWPRGRVAATIYRTVLVTRGCGLVLGPGACGEASATSIARPDGRGAHQSVSEQAVLWNARMWSENFTSTPDRSSDRRPPSKTAKDELSLKLMAGKAKEKAAGSERLRLDRAHLMFITS